MSDVVALPTACAEPLPKQRWHGCYPKGVTPISKQRYKRVAEAIRAAREQIEQPRDIEHEREIERRGMERLRQSFQADSWPWPGIDRRRFERLTESQRGALGFVFLDALRQFESRNGNA